MAQHGGVPFPAPYGRRACVLLGLSGSVASIKLPELVQSLAEWADVKVVATQSALRFVDPSVTAALPCNVLGTEHGLSGCYCALSTFPRFGPCFIIRLLHTVLQGTRTNGTRGRQLATLCCTLSCDDGQTS